MPYTPVATDITQPADNVKAATAPAEFRTLKLYIRDVILAGILGKAPINNANLTGATTAENLAVTGTASFSNYAYGVTPPPGDSSKKLVTTEFVVNLALRAAFPGATENTGKEITSDGTQAMWGISTPSALALFNYITSPTF